jgi:hypothetical protein
MIFKQMTKQGDLLEKLLVAASPMGLTVGFPYQLMTAPCFSSMRLRKMSSSVETPKMA